MTLIYLIEYNEIFYVKYSLDGHRLSGHKIGIKKSDWEMVNLTVSISRH